MNIAGASEDKLCSSPSWLHLNKRIQGTWHFHISKITVSFPSLRRGHCFLSLSLNQCFPRNVAISHTFSVSSLVTSIAYNRQWGNHQVLQILPPNFALALRFMYRNLVQTCNDTIPTKKSLGA